MAHWLQAAADGRPLVLIGDKESVRDMCTSTTSSMLSSPSTADGALPPVLNGSGHGTSLAELADTVLEVVGDRALTIDARPARA